MAIQCESCSMTIESGPYCQYCSDDSGALLPFSETVARFQQWAQKNEPEIEDGAARRKTLEFMSTMPAWSQNPELRAALAER